MGQRLVVTIHAFDEDIATIYYHWGAYTGTSLNIAKDLTQAIGWPFCKTKEELILALKEYLEEQGGGVDNADVNYFEALFSNETVKTENVSACNGLLAISEYVMNQQSADVCGEMTIDYDEQVIHNNCYNFYETMEDFISNEGEDSIQEGGMKELSVDPESFYFKDLDKLYDEMVTTGDWYSTYHGMIYGYEE